MEAEKLQQSVSKVAEEGRQLAHATDLEDHDKAVRIYRQVEDLKVGINIKCLFKIKDMSSWP